MTIRDVMRLPIIVAYPADAIAVGDAWLLQTVARRVPAEARPLFERVVLTPWVEPDADGKVHLLPSIRARLERMRSQLMAGEPAIEAIARGWVN